MNPESASSLVIIVIAVAAALVAGLAIGLVLARSRTRAAVDAALAQAGHAGQLELAQAQERLRADERAQFVRDLLRSLGPPKAQEA